MPVPELNKVFTVESKPFKPKPEPKPKEENKKLKKGKGKGKGPSVTPGGAVVLTESDKVNVQFLLDIFPGSYTESEIARFLVDSKMDMDAAFTRLSEFKES